MVSTVDSIAVGKTIPRVEGHDKVTGRAIYPADVTPPVTLWAANVYSNVPHGRIVSIDTSRARAVPGVRMVLIGADFPNRRWGRVLHDQPLLCDRVVRFVGDRVAVVAADDPDAAMGGAELVEVTYEELPAIFDPEEAMRPGAVLIHPEARSYRGFHERIPTDVPNLCGHRVHNLGEVAEGFARADLIVEHTFRTHLGQQGYLEPTASVTSINGSNRLEVWASNKVPYNLRKELAELIDLAENDILVQPVTVGADFGAKGGNADPALGYHIGRLTGRPVKFVATSQEELVSGSHRHPTTVTIRSGVTSDGAIVAREARVIFNSGAYGSLKPIADGVLNGSNHLAGPYDIPNLHVDAFAVYTNTPPSGYMRGPGHSQVVFAVESHTNLLAQELGMDPLEFRLRNLAQREPSGRPSNAGYVLKTAAGRIGWAAARPQTGPRVAVGKGLSLAVRNTGFGEGTSDVTLNPDGTVTVLTAMPDNGTGALTVAVQVVAEELGLPVERIHLDRRGTDALPVDVGSGASRVTNVAGHAAIAACNQLKAQLAPLAATMLGSEDVAWQRDGWTSPNGRSVSLEELAVEMIKPGDAAAHARVTVALKHDPDREHCTQAAEVEVDLETGQVCVKQLVTVQEVGAIINPLGHQSQIDGGIIQGFGLGLTEELLLDEGRVVNPHFGGYKLPNIRDVPELVTIHIPAEGGPGPYSAKAIGELPYIPAAGAIANAVADAIGTPLFELPLTAERVLAAVAGA